MRRKPACPPPGASWRSLLVYKYIYIYIYRHTLTRTHVRRDLTKDERMKINKISKETRKRNNERTEKQRSEFFWKSKGIEEPKKVYFFSVGGGAGEGGGGIR